jgi:hypothetical protein
VGDERLERVDKRLIEDKDLEYRITSYLLFSLPLEVISCEMWKKRNTQIEHNQHIRDIFIAKIHSSLPLSHPKIRKESHFFMSQRKFLVVEFLTPSTTVKFPFLSREIQ